MTGRTGRIYLGALRGGRRSILGWTIAAMAVAVAYLAFYPMIGQDQWQDMVAMFPTDVMQVFGMADVSDGAGYAHATVYALLGVAIVLIFALSFGARLIGGEEESGTLELELAAPVARGRIYAERLAALWSAVVITCVGLSLTVWAVDLIAALGISVANIWLLGIGMALLCGAFGTISFAIGAASGRRTPALAWAAAIAVISYLMSAIGPIVSLDWLSGASPFHWYSGGEPLRNGPSWSGYGWLILFAVVPGVAGWLAMRRRDLVA